MFYLRALLGGLGFVAALAYGLALVVLRRDRSRVLRDTARMVARLTNRPLGIRVAVEGEERLHAHRPSIVIANHQSPLDIPILATIFPAGAVIVGKKELRSIPGLGWLFRSTGNILIDRADTARAVERLHEVEAEILSRGVSVWIFPEGTWNRGRGGLLPFKKGAFRMAMHTGAPLVPVVVAPLSPEFDLWARRLRPGVVEVRVLEPIPTAGLGEDDLEALMETARQRMQDALEEMRAAQPRTTMPLPSASSTRQPPATGTGEAPSRRSRS